MRSKQINFYLTAEDQASLLEKLRLLGEFAIVDSISESCHINFLPSAKIEKMGVDRLNICLVRPNDFDDVKFTKVRLQPFNAVDILRSLAVEFVRCYHANGQLSRGRLYFVTHYYDGHKLIAKNSDFVKWGTSLIAKARSSLLKGPDSIIYFGPDALELKNSGLTLID